MSAVLTGTSSIDVRAIDSGRKADRVKWWCVACETVWVQNPVCWSCYEPGVLYASVRAAT